MKDSEGVSAAVHGVTKSQTQLSNWTTTTRIHCWFPKVMILHELPKPTTEGYYGARWLLLTKNEIGLGVTTYNLLNSMEIPFTAPPNLYAQQLYNY